MLTVLRKLSEELTAVARRASSPEMAPVLRALSTLMKQFYASERETPVEPRALREAIAQRSASFGGFLQQDAHEFFRLFLDWLQEDCLAVAKSEALSEQEQAAEDPVTRNFRFNVRHTWKCDGCGDCTSAVEDFYDISLDVSAMPPQNSAYRLHDLLAHYLRPEADIEKTCEKCQHKTASVEHNIVTLPEILVFHMMRFVPDWEKGTYQKCFHRIAIPQTYSFHRENVGPELTEKGTAPAYGLQGIVCHKGLGPGHGHYVADTKGRDGSWTCYDDSTAHKIDEANLSSPQRQENVYLAVYAATGQQRPLRV